MLEFAETLVIAVPSGLEVRDHDLNQIKTIELSVLAAEVGNDSLLLVATATGDLRVFNQDFV